MGKITELAGAFNRPVLVLQGDSHTFTISHPLGNLTRVVVEGGAWQIPMEYLKVRIEVNEKSARFHFERITPLLGVANWTVGIASDR